MREQAQQTVVESSRDMDRIAAALAGLLPPEPKKPKPKALRKSRARKKNEWQPSQAQIDAAVEMMRQAGKVTRRGLAEYLLVSQTTAGNLLEHLRNEGQVRLAGTGREQARLYALMNGGSADGADETHAG